MARQVWQWGLLLALLGGGWVQTQAQAQTPAPTSGIPAAASDAPVAAAEENIPDVSQMSADVLRIMVVQLYHQVHDLEAQVAQLKASAGAGTSTAATTDNDANTNAASVISTAAPSNNWVVKVALVTSVENGEDIQLNITLEKQKIGSIFGGLQRDLFDEENRLRSMKIDKKQVVANVQGDTGNKTYRYVNKYSPNEVAAQEKKVRKIQSDIALSEKKIADLKKQLNNLIITGETDDGQAISVQVSGDDVAIVKGLKAGDKVQVRGRIIRLGPSLQVESRTLVVQQ